MIPVENAGAPIGEEIDHAPGPVTCASNTGVTVPFDGAVVVLNTIAQPAAFALPPAE